MKNRKLITAVISLFFIAASFGRASAAGYYFSSSSGDDNRTAAQAQNPSTPWRTISKLNAIIGSLSPGDVVYLKRGDVFDGAISINASGTQSAPIVFDAYGSGEKPVINGLATVTGWSPAGNNIWEAYLSAASETVNVLLLNGIIKAVGRYPNSDAANGGYMSIDSYSANNSITDHQLSPNPDWSGGEVVIRKNHWVLDRNKINTHNGHTLNYTSQSGYYASVNFGYFIQNHPKALDQDGEWYHDNNSKKIGLYSSTGAPSAVQASVVHTLVTATNQSNISFKNLSFKGANQNAFELNNTQGVQILNCDILYSGSDAVIASGCSGLDIEDCYIYHTNNTALELRNSSGSILKRNKIKATGVFPGMGYGDSGSYEGILMDGDNETVEGNEIDSTGYIPITFRGNVNSIKNNFISNYNIVKDDGGGIYTWNNIAGAAPTFGSKIIGNVIINGKGAGAGTDDVNYQAANGIYMDDNTAGVEIKDNTVANCGLYGLYIHNGHELTISNNTFFNSSSQAVLAHDNYAAYAPIRNVNMDNNIFFSKDNSQLLAEFKTPNNDIGSFGTFDNNFYCRPSYDSYVINTSYQSNGVNLDLGEWKSQYGKDASSKKSPVSVSSYDYIRFEYNGTSSPKTVSLDGSYIDARSITYSGTITLAPYSSAVLMKQAASTAQCPGLGSITREQWNNTINGGISAVPFTTTPTKTSSLTGALETATIGDAYGARIKGYICPPQTGNYTFYIAGDDVAELWLSIDANAATKRKIASVSGWTNFREWNKAASQKSTAIYLTAGQKYYVEVLHKESNGGDHVSVAWTIPDGTFEGPIPGTRLSPNGATSTLLDQSINFPALNNLVFGLGTVTLAATASSGLPISYSIVSGAGSINGIIVTPSAAGTIVIKASQAGDGNYNAAPDVTQQFIITSSVVVQPCAATGSILREQWNNISGTAVAQIPVSTTPSATSQLTLFEGPKDAANLYGSRIRGYVCPPQTGAYTFYIAGDDATELWLSTDDNPANKTRIAYNLTWTGFREWYKFSSQQSAAVYLQGGQKYYIEALQKEGDGGDHLSIAWKMADGTFEAPIAGSRLSPFVPAVLLNQTISFGALQNVLLGASPVTLTASSTSSLPVSFSLVSGAATINGNIVTPTAAGTIIIKASQAGNTQYNAAADVTQQLVVTAAASLSCSGAGSILREQWSGVAGNDVIFIPQLLPPTSSSQLTNFEAPRDVADNFGARIRGYICAPQTGNYTFYISGDDATELWLSTDANATNKTKIAYSLWWTGFREWTKYAAQKSATIYLVAGQKYYVEALHKEGNGGDHISVAWTLPDGTFEAPIAGSRLSPYVAGVALLSQTINFPSLATITIGSGAVTLTATASSGLPITYSIVSGTGTINGSTVIATTAGAVIIRASQGGNTTYNAAADVIQTLVVLPSGQCTASGSILRELWSGVIGNDVAQVPQSSPPSSSTMITSFEEPNDFADQFASRIKGYICAPQTGYYTFWIAGDDATELWLSSDDDLLNKKKIAYNLSWTAFREWAKFATQKSGIIYLQAGKRYYIEALHKEGAGGDHLSVAWTLPDGAFQVPIAGTYLSPYVADNASVTTTRMAASSMAEATQPIKDISEGSLVSTASIKAYPNPFRHQTTIEVRAAQTGKAAIEVYDVSGRLLLRLFNGSMQKGEQKLVALDNKGLSPGTYFIRFVSATGVINYKVIRAL